MMHFIVYWLLAVSSLMANICETHHFHEIKSHITPNTLLILDIDDTLLVPEQMLGCDEWFQHRLNVHKSEGLSQRDALEKTLAEWEAIRHITQMELVEPETAQDIQFLQNQGYLIMGLTTQRLNLSSRTIHQLKSHGIDLAKTAPNFDDHYFTQQGYGILYKGGILFTAGTSKGHALFTLFDKIGYFPKRIVFLNDKATHLEDLKAVAATRGVEFVGLRYGFSDARKAAFRPEIADIQFHHSSFGRLLSDEEAALKHAAR